MLEKYLKNSACLNSAEPQYERVIDARLFFVALLVSVFALSFDASAQAQVNITPVEAPHDLAFVVPVIYVAPEAQPPATLVLQFAYPETTLEILEVVAAPALEQNDKALDYELDADKISMAVFGGTAPVSSGALLYLKMRVKPAAEVASVLPVLNSSSHGADSAAEYATVLVTSGNVRVIDTPEKHSADTEADWKITLVELMRVVQLYNAREYHCDAAGQDGYETGSGDQSCTPHNSDYADADWQISFSELLRMIQLYNAPFRMYHADSTSEDGFAPGPFGYTP